MVAAGLGQRLSPLTLYRPKPLLSVLERPLIDYTIEAFAQSGFEDLRVVLGHNAEIMQRYLEDSDRYGITIDCLHNGQYLRGNAPFDHAFRRFDGRRNIHTAYMLLGGIALRPFYALCAMALHPLLTSAVYLARAAKHLRGADLGITH